MRPFVQVLLGRAKIVVLVYDSRSVASLRDLDFWKSECDRLCPEALVFVAGTHADVDSASRVKLEDASAQAKEWKATHVLTSSKVRLRSHRRNCDAVCSLGKLAHTQPMSRPPQTSMGGSTLLTSIVDACADMKNS